MIRKAWLLPKPAPKLIVIPRKSGDSRHPFASKQFLFHNTQPLDLLGLVSSHIITYQRQCHQTIRKPASRILTKKRNTDRSVPPTRIFHEFRTLCRIILFSFRNRHLDNPLGVSERSRRNYFKNQFDTAYGCHSLTITGKNKQQNTIKTIIYKIKSCRTLGLILA